MIEPRDCNNCAKHKQARKLTFGGTPYDVVLLNRHLECLECLDAPPTGEKLPHWQPLVRR